MAIFTAPLDLRDLADRYALAVDRRDADILVTLFTSDGAVTGFGDNPIDFRGHSGLRTMIEQLAIFQLTMHNVHNQTFTIDDAGQVSGETTCIASHILPGADWQVMDMAIRYHNRYRHEGDAWRFAERALEILWVETRPVRRFSAAMMDSNLGEFQ
jgi:ketosteroid isomerase-like protein